MVASQKETGGMKIGIDARMINASGIGRYTKNLLIELQRLDKDNQYFIFLLPADFEKLKFSANFQKVLADFKWYGLDEQRKFPPILKKYNLDLLHVPHFNIPLMYPGKIVVTVHDMIHFDFKTRQASTHNLFVYELKYAIYKKVFQSALKKSQKIMTVSNFVKNELETRWQVKEKKIVVTAEAVEENLIKLSQKNDKNQSQKVLDKFGIKPPYIFYVGNAHPHKNVKRLIAAFKILRQNYQYLQLVLSGAESPFWREIQRQIQDDNNIKYTGFISDEELVGLYKNAQVYVFPSLSEGFGIPLLEAMACGCPVASSDRTSLPEVGGEAAIYFDPENIEDMVVKIKKILDDQKLRKDLILKGQERVKEFSFKKMAEQTLKVYQESI